MTDRFQGIKQNALLDEDGRWLVQQIEFQAERIELLEADVRSWRQEAAEHKGRADLQVQVIKGCRLIQDSYKALLEEVLGIYRRVPVQGTREYEDLFQRIALTLDNNRDG